MSELVVIEERVKQVEGWYRVTAQARIGEKRFPRAVKGTRHPEEREFVRKAARLACLEPVCDSIAYRPLDPEIHVPGECSAAVEKWLKDQDVPCSLGDEEFGILCFYVADGYDTGVKALTDEIRRAAESR